MRVAVEKVEGVEEAAVSLNDGEVTIVLAPGNGVTLVHLRDVIRDQGFTPREADVRMRGLPRRQGEALVLEVPGSGAALEMSGDADVLRKLESREGEPVVIRGRVEEDSPGRVRVVSAET